MIAYKFRLYPSKEQEEKLLKTLEICRWTYNYFLSIINESKKVPSRLKLQAELPKLKKEKPELEKVYSKVLQMVLHQLYSNLKALSKLKKNGKKVGRLRYKGKWFKTFVYNQSGFKIIKTGKRLDKLHLSKIGDIPIRIHREIEGKVKQVIIKRYKSRKWFALVCVETESTPVPKTNRVIGIDVGVRYFLTDNDGRQIENPRFYEKTLNRIRIEQRRLSRKIRGSKNWEKQRKKLAKLYERLVNQRDDFLHKLSRFYVNNYDVIVVEDLSIRNMVRVGGGLAQSILDASWNKFMKMLSYKAEKAGRRVIKVNPRGTSKGLSYENPLRDWISSIRILMRGWGSPDSLFERRPLLRAISFKEIVSGHVFSMKQEAPCVSGSSPRGSII